MKRLMMWVTVAATMAAMMALSGAALAQTRGGGDVCLSQHFQTIYDSGPSTCSSGPTSQAIAVNNSFAGAFGDSMAVAVNHSFADTFEHDTAVAVNNSEADTFFNSEGFAINNSFADADTDSEAYALDHCGAGAFTGEQEICSGDLLLGDRGDPELGDIGGFPSL